MDEVLAQMRDGPETRASVAQCPCGRRAQGAGALCPRVADTRDDRHAEFARSRLTASNSETPATRHRIDPHETGASTSETASEDVTRGQYVRSERCTELILRIVLS
jgi:hypothetical protein